MKKLFALLLCVALVLGLCACGSGSGTPETSTTEVPPTNAPTTVKSLKVLAIGNSFSVDAMKFLYEIAKSEGVEEIILGNLYIGGCPLDKHNDNAKSGEAAYKYYKNTTGEWLTWPSQVSLLHGLQDEQWDIITMQQGSAKSGIADSYQPHLDELIAFVNANKTNPDAKLFWHMTWAYQGDSDHAAFPNYGNSQQAMYMGIVNSLKEVVEPTNAFAQILPVGTAIQNARTGFVGDTLTRDGYHLSELGRVIAGYTWYTVINGQPLYAVNLDKFAAQTLTEPHKELIIDAVNSAIENPHSVTELKTQ